MSDYSKEPREGELKTGTIVRLKSGGPAMTVQWHDANTDWVICSWQFRGRAATERYCGGMLERALPDAQQPGSAQKAGAKAASEAKS